jgi:hypothetical protein
VSDLVHLVLELGRSLRRAPELGLEGGHAPVALGDQGLELLDLRLRGPGAELGVSGPRGDLAHLLDEALRLVLRLREGGARRRERLLERVHLGGAVGLDLGEPELEVPEPVLIRRDRVVYDPTESGPRDALDAAAAHRVLRDRDCFPGKDLLDLLVRVRAHSPLAGLSLNGPFARKVRVLLSFAIRTNRQDAKTPRGPIDGLVVPGASWRLGALAVLWEPKP